MLLDAARDGGGMRPARHRATPVRRLRPAPASAADRAATAASGGCGRAMGVSIQADRVPSSRRCRASCQQRFQPIQSVQRLARRHAVRIESRRAPPASGVRFRRSDFGRRGGEQRQRGERCTCRTQRAAVLLQRCQQRGGAAHHRRRHAGQLARHARPRSGRPRLRPLRAGTPRSPSIPSPASCAASAAAAGRPVRQARGNVWRRWCGSGSPNAAPPAPPRRSRARPASRCRGRSRPPRPASAGRPDAGWPRSRSSPP